MGVARPSVDLAPAHLWDVVQNGTSFELPVSGASLGQTLLLIVHYRGSAPSAPGWTAQFSGQVLSKSRDGSSSTPGGPVHLFVATKTVGALDVSGVTYLLGGNTGDGDWMKGAARQWLNLDTVAVEIGPTGDTATVPAVANPGGGGGFAVIVRGVHTHDMNDMEFTDAETGDHYDNDSGTPSPPFGGWGDEGHWSATELTSDATDERDIPHWVAPAVNAATELDANGVSGPWDVAFTPTSLLMPPWANESCWYTIAVGYNPTFVTIPVPSTPACPVRLDVEPGDPIPGRYDADFNEIPGWTPYQATFTMPSGTIYEVQVGLRIKHVRVTEVVVDIELPDGTRRPAYFGGVGDADYDLGDDDGRLAWFHATGYSNPEDYWNGIGSPNLSEIAEPAGDYWGPYSGNYAGAGVFGDSRYGSGFREMEDIVGLSAGGTWTIAVWDAYEPDFRGTVERLVVRVCLEAPEVSPLMLVV